MNITGKIRNVFGHAETLAVKTSYGVDTDSLTSNTLLKKAPDSKVQGASAHQVTYTTPISANPDHLFEANIYQLDRNYSALMSFQERARGASFKLKSLSLDHGGQYEAGYEAIWRDNHSLNSNASMRYKFN